MNSIKKIYFMYVFLFIGISIKAQNFGNFSGSFESNSQWYQNDKKTGAFVDKTKGQFISNNYLKLAYNYKNLTIGIQYEAYLPNGPLLGFSPKLKGNKIATYFVNYKISHLDITAGCFYEQFGNGLILRSWEDRQLGINNALQGIRIGFKATNYLQFIGVFAKQRNGFETSKGSIQGLDTEIDLDKILNLNTTQLLLGASYVGRYENEYGKTFGGPGENFVPVTVNLYSVRLNMNSKRIYTKIEYVMKGDDVRVSKNDVLNGTKFKGSALQFDLGYTQKGLGINVQFRRLENFSFYIDRAAYGNIYNEQIVNFIPALTKQHDYSLANIYVYSVQPGLIMEGNELRSGEIGGQVDLFYTFEKGSFLGGKYGTKIAINGAYWAALKAKYNISNPNPAYFSYTANFFEFGECLFTDLNIEIRKKISSKLSGILTYINTYTDNALEHGGAYGVKKIKSHTAVLEITQKFSKGKSFRIEAQHLWTKQDLKNWAAISLEFNMSSKLSLYIADMYNYGNDDKDKQLHYYSIGGKYTKGSTSFSLLYGRQRGGLLCAGGVCRKVPAATGLSINICVSF